MEFYRPITRIKKNEEHKNNLKLLKYSNELKVDFEEIIQMESNKTDNNEKYNCTQNAQSVQKVRNSIELLIVL